MTQKNKPKPLQDEYQRLEYCFEKGVNIKDRIIQITGEITDSSSFDWLDAALTEMERESRKLITIKINSPGGSVYEAIAMVDRIKESKCQIVTKCYGHAMSAASILLAAGNKRYMGSHSWIMYHEMFYSSEGRHSENKDLVYQVEREMKAWADIMAHYSNKNAQFWLNVSHKKDYYLNAKECLDLGVIDGIF